VIEKIPEKIPDLERVKERVTADLMKDKQEKKAKKDADACLSALKKGMPIGEAAEKSKLTPSVSGFFKRNDSIPNIGFEQDIAEAAFKLSPKNKFPGIAIRGKKGYYVIQLKERKNPDPKGFEKEKDKIKQQLLQQKQANAFDAFLSQIKNRSEISIEEGFLD
jgi:peptidyl-prolyl cis-trans isomerase D